MSEWLYQGQIFDESKIKDHIGFVYVILDTLTGKKYLGQKKFIRTPKNSKGKRVVKQSDWKKYYSSSLELQKAVAEKGSEHFEREILHLCHTKAEMNYLELKEQVLRDVLLSDDYYNAYIGGRINKKHLTKYMIKLRT